VTLMGHWETARRAYSGAGGVFSTRIRLAASRRRIGPMLV